MFTVIPKKVSRSSSYTPKQLTKRFDKAIIPFKARGSVIGVSSFIKKYKSAEIFYGYRNGDRLRLSHHAPRKTDGSSTTFYGRIEKSDGGSVITGKIMKPLSTCIFGGICILIMLLLALVCLSLDIIAGAVSFTAAAVLTFVLLFRDGGKTKKLTEFLQRLTNEE